jgi:cytochrome c-type biogenesis protein CcsB
LDFILFKGAIALYILSSLGYLTFLLKSDGTRAHYGLVPAIIGFALHTVSIIYRALFLGFFPPAAPFDAVSIFAWLVILLFLLMRYRDPSPFFGAIAAPVATVVMLYSSTLSQEVHGPLVPFMKSWWLPIHVLLALAGNGVFAVMAMAGLMYLLQERFIKGKKLGRFYKLLPSLETLDTINRHGLPFGFFLLTVGIISGAIWAANVWGDYWTWDPKETWSLITWLAYAAMAHQRVVLGWRGKKAAWMAILGFILVMFTFIGVSALLGGHHGFYRAQ